TEYFLWGIFLGIVCLILVLNFVMLLAVRDWIYLWYNLYMHFICMHLFCDAGLGFQYLWPDTPRLNDFMPVYLYVWAAAVAQTTFMQYFIDQNRQNSRLYRWVNAFKWLITGLLVLAIGVQGLEVPGREQYMYRFVSLTTSYLVPVILVLTILSLYEKIKRGEGDRMVRYYGYALAVQFAGYGLVAFMNLCQANGWPLPFDLETYLVLGATLLIDLVFFTYGLAYRHVTTLQGNQQLELDLLQNRQEAQQQVIDSLQDERRRLAQDLHDDVGPLLATAKGYLSRLDRSSPTTLLQRAQRLLDEAADELRTLSHQLLPRQLAQTGLAGALAEASRQASRRGIPVQFVTMGEARPLGEQREQLLFSLAVQLIRRAQNHAQVNEVTVQLLYHEEQVNLSVEDNGQPSSLAEAVAASLQSKADLLRADLLFDTNDAGHSVMVSVSIANPALA
uniref:sensor histidine kinase n=1 Tax=Persicitalea sp. TaxID=3100273 RepID=UPI00359378F2